MRVQFVPRKARLSLRNPKNLILVENSENRVVIRACDNFSEGEKAAIIRYLAAEGFISDEFERYRHSGWRGTSITWTVEQAQRQSTRLERIERLMIQLLVTASALWLALMAFAFLRS